MCRSTLLRAAVLITVLPIAPTPEPVAAQTPDTVRFTPEVAHPTFAVREPVMTIRPGTVLVSETNWGGYFSPEGGAFPGEVGPFFIEGATTNDILVVKVHEVRPNYEYAASNIGPTFGGLSADNRVRMLNDPVPRVRYLWELDLEKMTGTTQLPNSEMTEITIDLKPMLGRVAVAPRGEEAFGGLWPGDFGGNMDAQEIRPGATVFLPIFHDGAYFYFGDGHARQGYGEVNGSGLETSMDVVLEIDLIKGRTIDWPRIENDEYIMVAGSARPLIDAFRLAHIELVEWLEEDYGFGRWDAYQLLGQLAESTVANIVDPVYTVVAKFNKRYLPER
ncbi:MAG: acetamidase [Gemmatimonadetes bacterium]|nr:acetamidase [Gemmatimonadota bacterium]